MLKKGAILIFAIFALAIAQKPYLPGDTVLSEDNYSWTDNNAYSSNIFDEIALKQKVVMIFWGGAG